MFFKKKEELISPISGRLIDISEVNDQVFSKRMIGDGFAIIPSDNKVYAPYSGTMSVVFETGHAYGIKTKEGKEILIHLGIDTVTLAGNGFKTYVKQGEKVKQGQLLCEMDLGLIHRENLDSTCMVVFTDGTEIDVQKLGQNVSAKEPELIKI